MLRLSEQHCYLLQYLAFVIYKYQYYFIVGKDLIVRTNAGDIRLVQGQTTAMEMTKCPFYSLARRPTWPPNLNFHL